MSAFKGTQGKWFLSKEGGAAGLTVTLYGDSPVKQLGRLNTGSLEYIANARAIAAVPQLIAALEGLVKQWNACGPNSDFGSYFRNVRDEAVAALALAGAGKGE